MNIKSTNSWGYKIHNKWDGIVGMVESGEVDFSVCLNAIRLERLDVIDYAANSIWTINLIIYQFYSSSIVSSLLRHTVTLNIDSVKKLEESGFDVGVENLQFVTKAIEKHGEIDPYMKRIIDKKINPKSEYLVVKEGVQRIRKGHYAFFTDPSTSYWIIKNIFSEAEKCDLSEFAINKPEATAYLVPKKSPYKKLINYANDVLMETGLVERELRKWYGMKPKCVAGKTKTEESLVSVGIKDIASLLVFLSVGVIVSLTVLIMEIIVHQYHTEKTKTNERTVKIYIT
ncbi:Hypothetical protein CINCED_3A007806 [Cinara cedri]|uniref:Uncharacterized protein n=1 Tax=Cinara cedri TaxID=506608 RepID=A0A5E4M116_9HEMI|nr:Hypothetical protein CINCED_3A007806 [Cinara cedri]